MAKINGLQYTGVSISLVLGSTPLSFMRGDPQFDEVLAIVKSAMAAGTLETEEVGAAIEAVVHKYLNTAKKMVDLPGTNVSYRDGEIYFGETPMAGFTANRLVALIDEASNNGEDPVLFALPLARFVQRLESHSWNSENAGYHERKMFQALREDLYRFLEKGSMPLTSDGGFLAYKAIRGDWYSIHSGDLRGTTGTTIMVNGVEIDCTQPGVVGSGVGHIRNAVGDAPRIPLNMVNPDRNQTCSYGLHVASWDYLPHFSHAGGHVVLCKVFPEDVGSIPADYGDTKMRVAAYQVVDEFAQYYTGERANWGAVVTDYSGDDNDDDEDEGDIGGHIDRDEMPELWSFVQDHFSSADLVGFGRMAAADVRVKLEEVVNSHIEDWDAVANYVNLDNDSEAMLAQYVDELLTNLGF